MPQSSERQDGWYWVRVSGWADSQPALWSNKAEYWRCALISGAMNDQDLSEIGSRIPSPNEREPEPARAETYYDKFGRLNWGHPVDVGHLILQLQTFDPKMKVSSVTFINTTKGRQARAYGLSMSRERWDDTGWLNFALPVPEALAVWATPPEEMPSCPNCLPRALGTHTEECRALKEF